MPDDSKKVRLTIETEGDTSGAKKVERSLGDVSKAAEKASGKDGDEGLSALAEELDELTEAEIVAEQLQGVTEASEGLGRSAGRTSAGIGGLGRMLIGFAGGPIGIATTALSALFGWLKKQDEKLKELEESLTKATEAARDEAAAAREQIAEKERQVQVSEQLERAYQEEADARRAAIATIDDYSGAAEDALKIRKEELKIEAEIRRARQEAEREAVADDPVASAEARERQARENRQAEIDALKEERDRQREAQQQSENEAAKIAADRAAAESGIGVSSARDAAGQAQRSRASSVQSLELAEAELERIRNEDPNNRRAFERAVRRIDEFKNKLAEAERAVVDTEKQVEIAERALDETLADLDRQAAKSQAEIDRANQRRKQLDREIAGKETVAEIADGTGLRRVDRVRNQEAERAERERLQVEERAAKERFDQDTRAAAEEVGRAADEVTNDRGRDIAVLLKGIAQRLSNGTNSAELNQVAAEFEQALGEINNGRAEDLRLVINRLREQDQQYQELRAQIRNGRDGR
ncbi:MAG: hypothetical protein AAGI48_03770 [Verrucomicrobiota bacterium]